MHPFLVSKGRFYESIFPNVNVGRELMQTMIKY